jgi:hypothetical protein
VTRLRTARDCTNSREVGRQTPNASFRLAITSDMSYHSRAPSAYFRASSQVAFIFSGTDQACIMDRVGSLDIMTQMPKPVTTAVDRRSARGALHTCFKWLTCPRDSQKLLELSQAQCTCDSGASLRLSHQVGLEVMDRSGPSLRKPFIVLADQILRIFCINLDSKPITEVQETRQQVHRLLHRQNWPGTWREMLPHGPKDTMFALLSLLDANTPIRLRYSTMSAIGRVVRYCHPLVVPILICSPGMAIPSITTSIRECQQIFTQQARSDAPDIQALAIMMECLTSIAVFLLGLFKFSHEAQRTIFHVEGGIHLFKSYSIAALLCRTLAAEKNWFSLHESVMAQSTNILRKFELLGGWMYDDCPDSRKLKLDASLVEMFDQESSRQTTPKDHTWARLLELLYYLEVRQQCAAPGCSYTLVDGPLRQCAGCVRVAYCSRACQKHAWKHAIPHRGVCSVLAQLQKELQLPHRDVAYYDAPDELLDSFLWPPLANIALDHFVQLIQHDMDLLGERTVTVDRPDPNVRPEVHSNGENARTTVDGSLEGCDESLE